MENSLQLVVIKDYESAFDSVTLINIPKIISLADFQPLSIAKINIFTLTTKVLQTDMHSRSKSMRVERSPV